MIRHAVMTDVQGSSELEILTQGMPAALLPVLDEPLCGYGLHLLRRHGIASVWTADERISGMLGDGSLYRVALMHAAAWPDLNDDESVLLMRGDILTDMNLSYVMEEHMRSGATVTAVVHERIPEGWTGILLVKGWVLKQLPPSDSADEERRRLRSGGVDVQLVHMPGYWREITDVDSYHQAQLDLLHGKVGLPVAGKRQGHAIIAPGMHLLPGVEIRGRCYVGADAKVRAGTVLGADTVLGRGAMIKGKAYLENVCLYPNASLEVDAVLKNVLLIPRCGNVYLQQMVKINTMNT